MSRVRIPEADKDQSAFQEVDLGDRKSRHYLRSADKENIPPDVRPGLKRLTISPGANESTTSITRAPKVSTMRCST